MPELTVVRLDYMRRMERVIAWLRLAVVLVTGVASALVYGAVIGEHMDAVYGWGVIALYAAAALWSRPYRNVSMAAWHVVSGALDWVAITFWVAVTGGIQSEFYLLYYLLILSIAMRYALGEVIVTGIGTAAAYVAVLLMTTDAQSASLEMAALRVSYLLVFAVGSGVLARENHRHFRERLRQEAQRVAVEDVTATVSHDLKNPLAAINGLIGMLLDSTSNTLSLEQQGLLHRINANALQMSNLVSNLLDAELIKRGRQAFRPTIIDLNEVVRRVVEAQAHQAEDKHIGLVLDLSGRLSAVSLDGRLIERLVANLLSNAVKYTPEDGAIRVSTAARGNHIVLEVWDSGPDVPVALQSAVFDKFVRDRNSSGVGLGLYICRRIVEMHQGKISIRRSGGGVAFVVEFPLVRSVSEPGDDRLDSAIEPPWPSDRAVA